ncbi:acyltransferase domain-containing protein, partial [Streptomyces sp. NPDC051940]|uniref:acyltransferase domain-containing protein n=1 Tax=Streptomyces sp. NPDC051940 TaxID=3155675 RepID=UPI003421BFC5
QAGSRGVRVRMLDARRAFHSPHVAAAAEALAAEPVEHARPAVPFFSTRYGRLLGADPLDAAYWAAHAAGPVEFDDALGALLTATAPTHLVELGPRPQLLPLAGRSGRAAGAELLHPAPGPEAGGRELAEVVAALHRGGLDPVWEALYAPEQRICEPMRPYVFASEHRFWDRQAAPPEPPVTVRTAEIPDLGGASAAPVAPDACDEAADDPVLEAVVSAVAEVGGYARERVVRAARFYEDLAFDSVMIMQLKDRVESRLPQAGEVSVQELLPALRSVGALADFMRDLIMANTH